jgi:hypothetical protein
MRLNLELDLEDANPATGMDRSVAEIQQFVDWLQERLVTRSVSIIEARINFVTIVTPTGG